MICLFFLFISLSSSVQASGFFLQLTDIHLDLQYTIGSPANCRAGEFLGIGCCRSWSLPKPPYQNASRWGSHHCDLSPDFWQGTLHWIKHFLMKTVPLDFIILTGDIANHHDFTQTPSRNLAVIDRVSRDLANLGLIVFPVLGNHDTYPIDQLPPPPINRWLTEHIVEWWGGWLLAAGFPDDVLNTLLEGGYWTGTLGSSAGKHRLIGLNSLYWDNLNYVKGPGDPAGQWAWLQQVLETSYRTGDFVWILGHIFPGAGEATDWFTHQYTELIANYTRLGVIKGQFFGHSHDDSFFLLGNCSQGFIAPSLTPLDRNPSLRVYEYNQTTGKILDYYQFQANLTNIEKTNKVNFYPLYQLTAAYPKHFNQKTVSSPVSWLKFWTDLKNQTNLFQQWYNRYTTGYQTDNCTAECQQTLIDSLMIQTKS